MVEANHNADVAWLGLVLSACLAAGGCDRQDDRTQTDHVDEDISKRASATQGRTRGSTSTRDRRYAFNELRLVLDPGRTGRWGGPWVKKALQAAIEAWSPPCSKLQLSADIAARPNGGAASRDGYSTITFEEQVWCPAGNRSKRSECWSDQVPGMTIVYPFNLVEDVQAAGTTERRSDAIAEGDIRINALHFRWSADGTGRNGNTVVSLAKVLAHEIGHILGMRDPCAEQPFLAKLQGLPHCDRVPRSPSLMGPATSRESLTLADEERQRLCGLYGSK